MWAGSPHHIHEALHRAEQSWAVGKEWRLVKTLHMYLCPGSHKRQGQTCLRAWFKCHPSHKQSLNLQLESCDSPVPSSHSLALRTVLYLVICVMPLPPKGCELLEGRCSIFFTFLSPETLAIHATAFLIYKKNHIFFFLRRGQTTPKSQWLTTAKIYLSLMLHEDCGWLWICSMAFRLKEQPKT